MHQKVYIASLCMHKVLLVVNQSVYVVLCSMFTCGHFKHEGDAEQSLLSFSVRHHLGQKTTREGQDSRKHTSRHVSNSCSVMKT